MPKEKKATVNRPKLPSNSAIEIDANGVPFTRLPGKNAKCGVCGRPWVDGKCSAGFINHRVVN